MTTPVITILLGASSEFMSSDKKALLHDSIVSTISSKAVICLIFNVIPVVYMAGSGSKYAAKLIIFQNTARVYSEKLHFAYEFRYFLLYEIASL